MFKTCIVDNVFILRWAEIEPGDPGRMLERMAATQRQAGKKLIGIIIVPVDSPPPGPKERKDFSSAIEPALEHCSTLNLVLEGRGLQKTAQRMVAAGIFLVSGKKSTMDVFESFAAALAKLVLTADLAQRVRKQALASGCIVAADVELVA